MKNIIILISIYIVWSISVWLLDKLSDFLDFMISLWHSFISVSYWVLPFAGFVIFIKVIMWFKERDTEKQLDFIKRQQLLEEAYTQGQLKWKQEQARQQINKQQEQDRINAEKEQEQARISHRDADSQTQPYRYEIGRHANETLAIRYGIANLEKQVKEYWYYASGGVRKRNPDRDEIVYVPAETIRLQKNKLIANNKYEVKLTDYRDRKAIAIIEDGEEYVKTFYPIDDKWFDKHKELELVLKGNKGFSLKELATFHVQKAVGVTND